MPFSARMWEQEDMAPAVDSIRNQKLSSLHYVIVHRLSPTRGRIEAYHGLHVGGVVEFEIPGVGRRYAEVISQDGHFYECAFTRPFDAHAIRAKRLGEKVVRPDFRRRSIDPAPIFFEPSYSEDEILRYSPAMRICIIGVSASLLWIMLFALFT